MPTNIVERVECSRVLATDADRFSADVEEKILANIFYLRNMTGQDPMPLENPGPIHIIDRVVAVEILGQAVRLALRFLLDNAVDGVLHQCASNASGS